MEWKDDFLYNEVIAKAVMFPAVISPSPYISARIITAEVVFRRCSGLLLPFCWGIQVNKEN
ncbi:hypothetical protein J6590_056246, partial [Homalodisca vitripennis]